MTFLGSAATTRRCAQSVCGPRNQRTMASVLVWRARTAPLRKWGSGGRGSSATRHPHWRSCPLPVVDVPPPAPHCRSGWGLARTLLGGAPAPRVQAPLGVPSDVRLPYSPPSASVHNLVAPVPKTSQGVTRSNLVPASMTCRRRCEHQVGHSWQAPPEIVVLQATFTSSEADEGVNA